MNRHSRGFTLIELMVAVFVLGLVLAILAESFNAVAKSKVQGETRLISERQGRAIIWEMTRELKAAVQTPLVASRVLFIGQARMMDRVPIDSVTVSTLDISHQPELDGFSDEQIVSYTAVPNSSRRGCYLLMRSQVNGLLTTAAGVPAPAPMVLANNLLALHIRYFDGNSWRETWDSSVQPSGRLLPLSIAIDLVLAGKNNQPLRFSTMVNPSMVYPIW